MIKILVTGANGLLGQHLVKQLLEAGYVVVATGKGPSRLALQHENLRYYDADITGDFELQAVLAAETPEVVIHAAAITQVDDCQLQQDRCYAVNTEATARLLLDAETYSKHFIFLSTDF